jgi:PleD family two-component response regulator
VTKKFKDIGKSSADVITSDKEQYWKRVLIVDDDPDITTTFKIGIENTHINTNKKIDIHAYDDPRVALLDFQPNFYDLLLVDINMPYNDGFQLSEGMAGTFPCVYLFFSNYLLEHRCFAY